MTVKTTLAKADVLNKNGRIYTKEALERMIAQFEERKNLTGCFFGELDYPESSGREDFTTVLLTNVSHNVKKMWIEEGVLYGEIQILQTPAGEKIKELLQNQSVVFRSRAIGNVNEDGTVEIEKIISFDAVPADTDAFKGLL